MQFFTVALILALAVAANASLGPVAWGTGSTAIHAPGAWTAAPYAGAWAPAAAHWAAPASVTAWGPAAAHWAAPAAAHWAAPAAVTAWGPAAAHWGAPAAHWGAGPVLAAHAGPVVAAHAAPIAHSASYVAANRGSKHVAPLPGHIQSVKSLNIQPAPGTNW